MYDMNDAGPQMPPTGDLIPDGTFAKLRMNVRPGGTNGAVPTDAGLLKASRTSDAKMLDCEFTVVEGPFARRKFWQMFTVSGGKLIAAGTGVTGAINGKLFSLDVSARDTSGGEARCRRLFRST